MKSTAEDSMSGLTEISMLASILKAKDMDLEQCITTMDRSMTDTGPSAKNMELVATQPSKKLSAVTGRKAS